MPELARHGGRVLHLLSLKPPYVFTSPYGDDAFATLLIAGDPDLTPDQQWEISVQLVSQGCRFMMATGLNASSWDDSVDLAFLHSDRNLDPPTERYVMTTWHDDETPEEIAHFFIRQTSFDEFVPTNFLILQLGPDHGLAGQLVDAILPLFLTGA